MKNSYTQKEQYYGDYLCLDKILGAQFPESDAQNVEAHDEMLFIIIHQAYELWFKQIMHELDSILDIFSKTAINDNSASLQIATHRTNRIIEIWRLLVSQITVLETMTSMDFLDFRDLLSPASGFQSFQFRQLEAKLGLKMEDRHAKKYYEYQMTPEHVAGIKNVEKQSSLLELMGEWLERIPFWDMKYWANYELSEGCDTTLHPFWATYRKVYADGLNNQEMKAISMTDFDALFLGKGDAKTKLSYKSCQAILFITLYRDYPLLQAPYQFISKWLEIDELMAMWRYRHISMVKTTIGMRAGTGGSSGANYLRGAMDKHHIFGDIARLTTYLIPRAKLPKLPEQLTEKMRFSI
jgi:tryptophan 2,3-dioxygenase